MTAFRSVTSLNYEDAAVSLGDELRAARASRGLSVDQIEEDLRIKAKYIESIENCDLSTLPGKVYVDGFIKNYASYLNLDPDEILRRFDEESGFTSPKSKKKARQHNSAVSGSTPDPLAGFTPRKSVSKDQGGIGRLLFSLWPIVALIGIAFAVWFGIKAARDAGMIPENLSVISAADEEQPIFEANISDDAINGDNSRRTIERPADLAYAKLGTPPYWDVETDQPPADGPVSMIDSQRSGLFPPTGAQSTAANAATAQPESGAQFPGISGFDETGLAETGLTGNSVTIAAETRAALESVPVEIASTDPSSFEGAIFGSEDGLEESAAPSDAPVREFALFATQETWIEVKAASGRVRFSGILAPGDTYDIPGEEGLLLKVGNAGGLMAEVQGAQLGPFGPNGSVMRNIDLQKTAILDRLKDASSTQ